MAYQNITFPNPKLIHGLRKEVIRPTLIISNGTTEYRLNKSASTRSRWTWPARAISNTERGAIVTFMETVGFSLDSFDFVCPYDHLTYSVRFDQSSLAYSVEAMDQANNVIYVNMNDITLIEVIE